MAKKKRRVGTGAHARPSAAGGIIADIKVAVPVVAATVPCAADPAPAVCHSITEADVELAVRAAHMLQSARERSAMPDSDLEAFLAETMRPLVVARATKYEEDARAAKLAEVAAGSPANPRIGIGGATMARKRPLVRPTVEGAGSLPPIRREEMAAVARVVTLLTTQPDALASKTCKPLRAALHPLVEAQLREEKASPAFRITCALGQQTRWPEALRLLAELRALEPGKRPKLGAYQRWVREVNAAEGSARELAMLDAIMRVAGGLPAAATAIPSEGSLCLVSAWQASTSTSAELPAGEAGCTDGGARHGGAEASDGLLGTPAAGGEVQQPEEAPAQGSAEVPDTASAVAAAPALAQAQAPVEKPAPAEGPAPQSPGAAEAERSASARASGSAGLPAGGGGGAEAAAGKPESAAALGEVLRPEERREDGGPEAAAPPSTEEAAPPREVRAATPEAATPETAPATSGAAAGGGREACRGGGLYAGRSLHGEQAHGAHRSPPGRVCSSQGRGAFRPGELVHHRPRGRPRAAAAQPL